MWEIDFISSDEIDAGLALSYSFMRRIPNAVYGPLK